MWFVVVALSIVVLIHFYLWHRLVRATTRPGRWRKLGTVAFIALTALVIATFVGSRVFPHRVAVALAWPGYLWLAVMFYLVLLLALVELPRAIIGRLLTARARRAEPEPAEPEPVEAIEAAEPLTDEANSRRLFLARATAITAGLVAVGVTSSGVRTALGPPRLHRIQIPLAKLPRSADGLRIALVSDIHLGPLRGLSHSRRIVYMINGLDADLVAVVGDLVDGSVAELGAAAAPLRDLRSKFGSFFVTGNHEYFSGFQEWVDEVRRLGLRPLRNERVELPGGLDLAGVNDRNGESFDDGPDHQKALAGRDPARPVVMLAHQPVQATESARLGVDLQLSGHTHGGQLWPFKYVVRATGQPVVSGLGEVDGMPVYVTNGAGFWGPPVRVGAPPGITLVELRTP